MINVGVDVMGGDFAPQAALEGILQYLQHHQDDSHITLFGQEEVISPFLEQHQVNHARVTVVPTSEVIDMSASPTRSIVQKKDSSIVVGLYLLAQNKIDAFVSAGNTGAVMVGALQLIKNIPGILRPTITSIVPKLHGPNGLLLDVGANADCKPEFLEQFAVLGSIFLKHVYQIEQPKVGLFNIGSEPEKGNLLTQNTFRLLQKNPEINFVGNIEGYDLFTDKADVVVCDGFTGNTVLKSCESMYQIIKKKNLSDEFFDKFNYQNYGGTPFLGVQKPVIIGHGVSDAIAFDKMIQLGREVAENKVVDKIRNTIGELKATE